MGAKNKFIKSLGYLFVYFMTLIESYLIALLIISVFSSLICAVWSFITPLPSYIGRYYGVLMLQGAIPVSIGIFIYIIKQAKK